MSNQNTVSPAAYVTTDVYVDIPGSLVDSLNLGIAYLVKNVGSNPVDVVFLAGITTEFFYILTTTLALTTGQIASFVDITAYRYYKVQARSSSAGLQSTVSVQGITRSFT